MKRCTKCHIEKELSEFNKRNNSKSGYKSRCRECTHEDSRIYKLNNEEHVKERNKKKSRKPKSVEYRRQYYIDNKENILSKQRKRYILNKSKIDESKRAYNKTDKGKLVKIISKRKRRAMKFGTDDGTVTTEFTQQLADSTKYCIFTGIELTAENRHLDHIIPLSRGGKHSADNVRFISAKANRIKGNKLDSEFLPLLYDYLMRKSSKEILLQRYAN